MLKHLVKPRHKGESYRARFRVGDIPKIHDVCLHTRNKEVAQKKLDKLYQDHEEASVGIGPSIKLRQAAQRPLCDLFEDFVKSREDKARSHNHLRMLRSRFPILSKECNWSYLKDITIESVDHWIKSCKRSPKTINNYLDAVGSFLNWLVRTEQLERNPLRSVEKLDTRASKGKNNRALSMDELERLLRVAPKRRFAYMMFAYTGLRVDELKQLKWIDIQLEGSAICEDCHIQLRPEANKARRADIIPILPVLEEMLRNERPKEVLQSRKVLPNGIPSLVTLRADMKKAGIPEKDSLGRTFVRHGFRKTFVTMLQNAGLPPRVIMQLARHKSLELTNHTYTDDTKLPLYESICCLPHPVLPHSGSQKSGNGGQRLTKVDKSPTSGSEEDKSSSNSKSTSSDRKTGYPSEIKWRRERDLDWDLLSPCNQALKGIDGFLVEAESRQLSCAE